MLASPWHLGFAARSVCAAGAELSDGATSAQGRMAAASPGEIGHLDGLHPLCFGNLGPSARREAGRDAFPVPPAAGQSGKSKSALFHPSSQNCLPRLSVLVL